ncbi:L-lactate permease [Anaerosphaera multitolerans]|uniref:L-lactate permease n=1 Tax=Anaerosphaera multitolerans TaxID=2487351 RepID=A0A437S498_9FIRM|nr:L-lactate permease [Anaerosphaera multitolerans]RVU53834.1 L-lactate permease [Anaerosphaera multitolerans]
MIYFLLALVPILFLIIALVPLKMASTKACAIALVITSIEAFFIWKQSFIDIFTGALEGLVMGIWPISLVIVAAVFTYNIVVSTGNMEIIKRMLTAVSRDKRILILIIAWGFGGFIEGMAGFGTAVAIPAGILIGLGFEPVFSAVVCLVANTTPVAFGAIGLAMVTSADLAGTSSILTSTYSVIQMAFMTVAVPFLIVYMVGKNEGRPLREVYRGVGLVTAISGVSFLVFQFLTAYFIGGELSSIIGSVFSMVLTVLAARFFKNGGDEFNIDIEAGEGINFKKGLVAWAPFILVLVFLLGTSNLFPRINSLLATVSSSVRIYSGEGAADYIFNWLSTPGTLIIIAATIGGLIQRCSLVEIIKILFETVKQTSNTILTIVFVLATSKIMGYSGMTVNIADFIVAVTGNFYPLVSPLIGSIGTFVTGSTLSSVVLFTEMQASTALDLGIDVTWMVAANIVGSTAGKIISPQSIAVAAATTNTIGRENEILKAVLKYYLLFIVVYGLAAYMGVYFL